MDSTGEQNGSPAPEVVSFHWRGRDVLWIALGVGLLGALLIGGFVLLRDWAGLQTELGEPSLVQSGILTALEGAILLGAVYLFGLLRRRTGWGAVGLRRSRLEWLLVAVLLGFAVIPISILFSLLLYQFIDLPVENPQLEFIAPEGFSWSGMILMVFMGGILAPIAEEVIFRGVLFDWLRSRWGVLAGVVISSLVFGLVHIDPVIALQASLIGLVMAWIYQRSGSLWPAIIIHGLNNGLKIILLYAALALQAGGYIP